MKYNIQKLFNLIPPQYSDEEKIGCGWILYQINDDQRLSYSDCNAEKKKLVDLLVQDQMLAVKKNVVVFSAKLLSFLSK